MPVLIVEPDATVMITLEDMLKKLGFRSIEVASDTTSALEILHGAGPRLVIADLHLQPTSGLHLLRAIRSDEKLKRSPFILSANTLSSSEATAIKHSGADCFLLKPFKLEALEPKVEAAFRNQPMARPIHQPKPKKALSTALGRRFGYWA
jgi:two-component system, chemotaxis family, chemotaxis protein CheY